MRTGRRVATAAASPPPPSADEDESWPPWPGPLPADPMAPTHAASAQLARASDETVWSGNFMVLTAATVRRQVSATLDVDRSIPYSVLARTRENFERDV